MSSFWYSQSLNYLPESKGYAPQSHQLSETDIVNVLQQRNFEEVFEQIVEGINSQLQEYFCYIASSQQRVTLLLTGQRKKVIHRNH